MIKSRWDITAEKTLKAVALLSIAGLILNAGARMGMCDPSVLEDSRILGAFAAVLILSVVATGLIAEAISVSLKEGNLDEKSHPVASISRGLIALVITASLGYSTGWVILGGVGLAWQMPVCEVNG